MPSVHHRLVLHTAVLAVSICSQVRQLFNLLLGSCEGKGAWAEEVTTRNKEGDFHGLTALAGRQGQQEVLGSCDRHSVVHMQAKLRAATPAKAQVQSSGTQ